MRNNQGIFFPVPKDIPFGLQEAGKGCSMSIRATPRAVWETSGIPFSP
jgi:hypothetical protein